VAVVARAVWAMGWSLCPDRPRATLAVGAALVVLAWPGTPGQLLAILGGGLIGWTWLRGAHEAMPSTLGIVLDRRVSIAFLVLFVVLLIALPVAAGLWSSQPLALADSFYRSGALVFGGGHVVLPLLQSEVVPPGWLSNDAFLAGYGAAQAVPGPLFTFAAYVGTVMTPGPNGLAGGIIALVAIFVPSFLLVVGALPFWDALRQIKAMQTALLGVNAAVVGLLLAALYNPVWTSAILVPADFALAIAAFTLLVFWKVPPWLVVILTALGGWSIAALPSMLT